MATKQKKKSTEEFYNPVDMQEILTDVEKTVGLQNITLGDEGATSTGYLAYDIIMGQGIRPGMTVFAGAEQSGKTTTSLSIMASASVQGVPFSTLWDAENSSGSSLDYVTSIFQNVTGEEQDVGDIFGVRNKKGEWLKTPKVYYRDEGIMENFFDWFAGMLRRLPDKRVVEVDGEHKWFYVYKKTRENAAKYKGKYDVRLSSERNGIFIPAPDSSLQAIVLLDSLPNLIPESMDQEEKNAGLAAVARGYSMMLPKVKGKLRAKRVAFIAINQLAQVPMAMGNPWQEKSGSAVKTNSDARFWNMPRALSSAPTGGGKPAPVGHEKAKGQIEVEDSIEFEGSQDQYRYICCQLVKNKLSSQIVREVWIRLWIKDGDGVARGIDPVWDTYYALLISGQVTGKAGKLFLDIKGLGKATKSISWEQFKHLVLMIDPDKVRSIYESIGLKPVNLRAGMFRKSKSGELAESIVEHQRKKGKKDEEQELTIDDEDGEMED